MRQPRVKAPEGAEETFYHCISRIAHKERLLHDLEKEQFVKWMRIYETFSGVQIVTFVVLENHFHILTRVPRRPDPENLPSDDQLVALVELIDGSYDSKQLARNLKALRLKGHLRAVEELREIFFKRMWNVSQFMKSLKERFAQWLNKRLDRSGPVWNERFKSPIVETLSTAVAHIAAYIDLNPVRAAIVNDPKDYRWCGYAEAVAGQERAGQGLALAIEGLTQQHIAFSESQVQAKYRQLLFEKGIERLPGAHGQKPRLGFTQAEVDAVIDRGGKLLLAHSLFCRVRYFTDGLVFGTKAFVAEVMAKNGFLAGKFGKGPRPLKHIDAPDFFIAKDLRNKVILGSSP